MFADLHMKPPTFQELKNEKWNLVKKDIFKLSNPTYGIEYIRDHNTKSVYINLKGLRPNNEYEIFIYMMSLNEI